MKEFTIIELPTEISGEKEIELISVINLTSGIDVAGVVTIGDLASRSAWLKNLFVSPVYRCCGVATQLIERARGIARGHDCVTIALSVNGKDAERQEQLRTFYTKQGFTFAFRYDDKSELWFINP